MATPARNSRVLHFGAFEADLQEAELRKGGIRIKLQEQPFQILSMLLERPGQTVTREELRQRLWPADTFVDFDHSLNSSIKKLREALGDDSDNPRFIETLHRRGYRFVAPVDGPDATALEAKRQNPGWVALWLAATAILMLSGATAWFLRFPSHQPRVARFRQITTDGRAKSGDRYQGIATDGQRVYFQEIENDHFGIREVSVTGGQAAPLPLPFSDVVLYDISPDRHALIIGVYSNPESTPLWILPLPAGPPHRLGELSGTAATWSPDGRAIYVATRSGIYITNIDGTSVRKLLSLRGEISFLRCSPDGRRLRFTVFEEKNFSFSLWQIASDGTDLRPLLAGWHDPPRECCGTWTPDGKYYLFQTYSRMGESDLWALPERAGWFGKTTVPLQLTNGPLTFLRPQPSADGQKIFVVGLHRHSELVRFDPKAGFVPFLGGISANGVAFTADGRWVAYVAQPEGTLWRSRTDGAERLQLTYPPMEALVPRWSPDGKQIAFIGIMPKKPMSSFLISSEGGVPQQILPDSFDSADPGWSRDGREVVLTIRDSGLTNQRISIVDLATKKETRLPRSEHFFSPRWSPDGKYIAAISNDQRRLVLFDCVRRQWSELANMWIGYPSWSHDGEYLYFDSVGREAGFYRVRIFDRRLERLANLNGSRRLWSFWLPWSGLAPDDSLLLQRDISSEEIYALDWQEP